MVELMAYDPEIESRRLISDGVPDLPFRLSRRQRLLPLAVDVDGDVAATLFARRGVSGSPSLESWVLQRQGGEWTVLGGGGGEGHWELLEPRESIEELYVRYGQGWTATDAASPLPWRRRGVSHAELRFALDVASLRVGDRNVDVARHGVAIVCWRTSEPPEITALAASGRLLGPVTVPTRRER